MALPLIDTALGLLGFGGLNNVPVKSGESRLKSANDARALLNMLIREDTDGGRSRQRAIVKGMVDGNPPYDDRQRQAEGRSWECNLNFMEGQAIMNRTAVPYYNLFARVDYYADCCTAFRPNDPNYTEWNSRISYRFDQLLKRWKGFNWNVQQASYWMRLHGMGFLVPENDYSFRVRSVETGAVLVPKGSPSCLDYRIPYICIRVPYRAVELWKYIEDSKTAEAKGWNKNAVQLAIKYGIRGASAGTRGDWWAAPWEKYERLLKNSDLVSSWTDGDLVDCCVMLVQEAPEPGAAQGKISKFIFTEWKTVTSEALQAGTGSDDFKKIPEDSGKNDFMYADPNCYDSYLEGLIPFFRNTGDGTWHSVRGYAMEAFKHIEVSNRLKCQMVNRAFLDSSVVIQNPTERNRKRFELSVWGATVSLPGGVEIKPTVVQGGTDGVIAVDRVLENHLQSNMGVGASPRGISREDGRGEMPTARQVDYVEANEASIGEGEITQYYYGLDDTYLFMFNRASDPGNPDPEAKRFRQELIDDGVPKEALKNMRYVRANRQSGYGSPGIGIMRMNQVMPLVPMFPEDGKNAWLKDQVLAIAGPDKAQKWVPAQHVPDNDDWEVSVENMMISQGRVPQIVAGQDDVIHLNGHFQDAFQTLAPTAQAMGQGQQADPQTLQQQTTYAQAMAQHIEAHLARLSHDPTRKAQAKLFEDQFKQLSQFSAVLWDALRNAKRQIQIEQQQNQQATALSALDQAKVQSVQTQAQVAAAKAQSQIQNQQAKTLQGMRLKDLKTAHDIGIDRINTAHNINMDRAETQSNIQLDSLKTASDLRNNRVNSVPQDIGE